MNTCSKLEASLGVDIEVENMPGMLSLTKAKAEVPDASREQL